MRRLAILVLILAIVGAAVFWVVSTPRTLAAIEPPPGYKPSVGNGQLVFNAGGCASCHAAPDAGACDNPHYTNHTSLGGGRCLKTPFGTFNVPNISSDQTDGIGAWTDVQFVNALTRGVSPAGEHYYPAFPFTSYQRMTTTDVLDLRAYLATLPAVSGKAQPHDLALPFRWRRLLGAWKLLYFDGAPFAPDPHHGEDWNRGAYLVEGPGHCGECHTPRDALGGFKGGLHLAGGPAPDGKGWVPNLTQAKDGLGGWSQSDIADMLGTGFLPSGDVVGGSMAAVQDNLAKLPTADQLAIAAYLKSLPTIENPRPKK